jgi:hypothetical protein
MEPNHVSDSDVDTDIGEKELGVHGSTDVSGRIDGGGFQLSYTESDSVPPKRA